MLLQRGVPGVRVLMGLVSLTNKHADTAIDQACHVAQSNGAYRLRVKVAAFPRAAGSVPV